MSCKVGMSRGLERASSPAVPVVVGSAEFALLSQGVVEEGLLGRTPWRYAGLALLWWAVLLGAGFGVGMSGPLWVSILSAIVFGAVLVQIGALGHDAGHGQIAASAARNRVLAWWHWTVGMGMSTSWWQDKHTRHHAYPNDPARDADFYSLLSYTRAEAESARGVKRFVATYQALCFPWLISSLRLYFQWLSLRAVTGQPRLWIPELLPMLAHHGCVLFVFTSGHGVVVGLGLLLLSYAVTGLYTGLVFAPNHLGMPLNHGSGSDPLAVREMVGASRNIETPCWFDPIWVGLNYQVEHHLFPGMSRFHLRSAAGRVRPWCTQHGLAYLAEKPMTAWRVVLRSLGAVGSGLRREGSNATLSS